MRSAASRRGLALLILAVVLGGCASPTKKRYLKHLSTTIAPVATEAETMAAADGGGSAVAAVDREETSPR